MLITATADKENYAMQSNAVYKVMRTVPTNESQLKFLQIMYQHADGDQKSKLEEAKEGSQPAIWIDAGIHAREWIAPSTALYIINYNRNFDFKWNQQGGSQDPCQETYSGRSAFSEPETQAIERFILQRADQLGAFLTLHSYSQIWMYPYGNQRYSYPKDVHDLNTVCCVILDPASGGSEDWAKAVAGIKYSFLVELRPEEDNQDGFILDESHIIPTGKETLEGIKEVAMVLLPGNRDNYFPNTDASSVCQDFHPMCKIWAVFGACLNDTEVRRLCVKSCELCSELDSQDEKLFIAIGAAESAKDIYEDADWLPGLEKKGALSSISRIVSKMKAQSFPLPENSVCQIGNANLPRTLMWRKGGKAAWLADPPLTTVGCNTAKMYAEGLVSANVLNAQLLGNCVYAAPNFRCVQTADIILKVVDPSGHIKIRIEPKLEADSELMDKNQWWHIKTDQFSAHNIHRVDTAHKSKKRIKDFSQRNEILDEIQRNHDGNVALFIVSDWKIKDLCNAICNCEISSEGKAACENRALSSPKGLVLGDLVFQLGNTEIVDCNSISTIPTRSDEFQVLTTSATFILIVEKDSIFEKLAMEKANSVLRSAILVTAKGYPDFPTRLFLRKLYDYLKLPMFALMDADPCGIEIFLTYKYGPMNVSYESGVNVLLPWMKWIGVYPSEISSLNLSDTQKLMLGIRERKLIYSLLNRFEASGDHFLISQPLSVESSPGGGHMGGIAIALVKSYAFPSGEKRNCESNKDLIKSISSVQRGPNCFDLETLKYLADLSEVNVLATEEKITTTKTFHENEFDSEKAHLDEIIAILHGHSIRHSQIHIN
ncbi:carboxypeptidase B [Trichinella spiralis]|nr:carboxypeptidase B [Trichinella spiralis]